MHPLSRHRAHRAQPEDEDGKRQPLNHTTRPPRSDRAPTIHPAAEPTAVANLRLVRTPIRTMIVIIILAIHNHDNPF